MLISIIICTLNRPRDLRDCLKSITHQDRLPDEVIIVDSSSDQRSAGVAADFSAALPLRYFHTRPSLTYQRNFGIQQARGEIFLFLDDDVILTREFLRHIERSFLLDDRVAGAGGLFTNITLNSPVSRYLRKIFMLTRVDGHGHMQKSGFAAHPWGAPEQKMRPVEVLCGAAAAFRREIFSEFSFDEFFSGYGLLEDADFSYRVGLRHRLLYNPEARIYHRESAVSRINLEKFYFMKTYNHYYLFRKNLRPRNISWLPFWWSNLGVFIRSLIMGWKGKTLGPIKGALRGNLAIIREGLALRDHVDGFESAAPRVTAPLSSGRARKAGYSTAVRKL
jgi:glycosyltransferase involved in cell wall biosynthesis